MGQSPSSSATATATATAVAVAAAASPDVNRFDSDTDAAQFLENSTKNRDYTMDLPDDCLAGVFQFLSSDDRKQCSLVNRRWFRVDGQSRHQLSLNAQQELPDFVPSLFTRFDSVTNLALRCDRKSTSINDDVLILISLRCKNNLMRIEIRGCNEISGIRMADIARNCKNLRTLKLIGCWGDWDNSLKSIGKNCPNLQKLVMIDMNPGALGVIAIASNCKNLEKLVICGMCTIGDDEMEYIATKCVALKKLCIKECKISNVGIEYLALGCPNLVKIKVEKCNRVTGRIGIVNWLLERRDSLVFNFDDENEFEVWNEPQIWF